jgi:septation ring formation regulator EzrA
MSLFGLGGGGGIAAMLGVDTEQMEKVFTETMDTLKRYDEQLKAIAESQERIEKMLKTLRGDLVDKQPDTNQE